MEKNLVVYRIFFDNTDKCYIGITNNFDVRKKTHIRNAKRGMKNKLYDTMRKYGDPQFEILCVCETVQSLYESEQLYIQQYNSFHNGLNLTLGGEGSFGSARPKSKEWREEHSKKMKEFNPRQGHIYDDDEKKKHADKMKEFYKINPNRKAWGNKSALGLIWITNGIETKKIRSNQAIPDGYVRGRKI